MDPSVVVDGGTDGGDKERQFVVGFKCRVGEYPSLEEFYVVLYDDKYYAKVFEIWQFRIQAKLRVDIHAVMGQRATNELIIRGDHAATGGHPGSVRCHVKYFTTWGHAEHMQFRPSQHGAAHWVPRARESRGRGHARTRGRVERARVDFAAADHENLRSVAAARPARAEENRVRESVGAATDGPAALLRPRDAVLQIPSNGNVFLRLGFAPVTHKTREAMYLFINDKHTDQNEECLLFQVTYE